MRFTALPRRLLLIQVVLLQACLDADSLAAQTHEEIAERYLQAGLRASSIDDAIEKYREALEHAPTLQPAIYRLGVSYFRKGDYHNAIETLERVDSFDSTIGNNCRLYLRNSYTLHGQSYLDAEEFGQAILCARQALDIDPAYVPGRMTLGRAYLSAGKLKDAIGEFKQALARDRNQEQAWLALGEAFLRSNRAADAANAYRYALSLNPRSADAALYLQQAEEQTAPQAWLGDYEAAYEQEDPERARQVLDEAQKKFPGDSLLAGLRQQLLEEENYRAGVQALAGRQWQAGIAFLEKVNPEFRDAKLRLEEARAEITLSAAAQSPGSPAKQTRVTGRSTPRPVRVAATGAAASDGGRLRLSGLSAPRRPPPVNPAPATRDTLRRQLQARARPLVQSSALLQPETSAGLSARAGERTTLVWVALGLFVFGFGFLMRRRFAKAASPHERETSQSDEAPVVPEAVGATTPDPLSTQELFQAELVSETISFSPAAGVAGGNGSAELFVGDDPLLAETVSMSGRVIAAERIGRYYVERQIGRGSMGLVFMAWDPTLDRTVVIKNVALDSYSKNERTILRDRLHREASAAGKLSHPNIVTIYDVGEEAGHSYIVMEYLKGLNLRVLLDREGSLPPQRAARIALAICDALDFAHSNGVVHRDIKPSNIIITDDDRVKVADFGIAKLPKLDTLTRPGDIVGTPFYMSPEQIEGRQLDGRSDIFSTGVLLYEMLTGTRPFEGENIPEIVYKIVYQPWRPLPAVNEMLTESFDAILQRALAKEPTARYQCAGELAEALRQHGAVMSNDLS